MEQKRDGGAQRDGKTGREEPSEIQQRQVQGPAPGAEQPQAPAQPWAALLGSSSEEKDLGVLVDNKLSMSQQRVLVAKKASGILGTLGRALPAGHGRILLDKMSIPQLDKDIMWQKSHLRQGNPGCVNKLENGRLESSPTEVI
ncbi:hypothetical protein HGM15179_012589, partial [Zosterops borbonicus]